jgi:hypothetical protein
VYNTTNIVPNFCLMQEVTEDKICISYLPQYLIRNGTHYNVLYLLSTVYGGRTFLEAKKRFDEYCKRERRIIGE